MNNIKSHNQFLLDLETKQPKLFKLIEVIGVYEKAQKHILVKTKYGNCLVNPQSLLGGHFPSIQTAINKNEYFAKKANIIHNNEYDYSLVDYIDKITKIKIISSKGIFEQTPSVHLQGWGNLKLGRKTEGSARDKHNLNKNNKLNFFKLGLNSKHFDSFKVYIIKCYNENEVFYKIGKTFKTVNERFKYTCNLPYNYEVIDIITFDKTEESCKECCELEQKFHNYFKRYKYIPTNKFAGMYECFYGLPIID